MERCVYCHDDIQEKHSIIPNICFCKGTSGIFHKECFVSYICYMISERRFKCSVCKRRFCLDFSKSINKKNIIQFMPKGIFFYTSFIAIVIFSLWFESKIFWRIVGEIFFYKFTWTYNGWISIFVSIFCTSMHYEGFAYFLFLMNLLYQNVIIFLITYSSGIPFIECIFR